eukprot:TRINITY_DN1176_c0_g2_i1.p1 TRINITY_DN1176_c0_g2~~TRINITY_DN1176_c0_g2_i1.p1  ORF type:complete len:1379 (-),score=276.34 TRINITY_DN1176_c0_g2_i1:26-4132(-)
MSEDEDFANEDLRCPLCVEELDYTDKKFVPCQCGYQICRFCWNYIMENLNGRCPACRKAYEPEKILQNFTPPDPEQLIKHQNEKKQRERQRKQQETSSRKHLTNMRVIQRNLVYVTNLPLSIAKEETLRKQEFFGQYGKIVKVVVNKNNLYNVSSPHGPSVSAYITYSRRDDALAAINSVDGFNLENRVLRASFGTTKYCTYFLKNVPCTNPDCMYLHELGGDRDSFTKEDMANGKQHFHEQTHPTTFGTPDPKSIKTSSDSIVLPTSPPPQCALPPPSAKPDDPPISDTIAIKSAWKSQSEPALQSELNPSEWPAFNSIPPSSNGPSNPSSKSTSPPKIQSQSLSQSQNPSQNSSQKPPPNSREKSFLPATASWGRCNSNLTVSTPNPVPNLISAPVVGVPQSGALNSQVNEKQRSISKSVDVLPLSDSVEQTTEVTPLSTASDKDKKPQSNSSLQNPSLPNSTLLNGSISVTKKKKEKNNLDSKGNAETTEKSKTPTPSENATQPREDNQEKSLGTSSKNLSHQESLKTSNEPKVPQTQEVKARSAEPAISPRIASSQRVQQIVNAAVGIEQDFSDLDFDPWTESSNGFAELLLNGESEALSEDENEEAKNQPRPNHQRPSSSSSSTTPSASSRHQDGKGDNLMNLLINQHRNNRTDQPDTQPNNMFTNGLVPEEEEDVDDDDDNDFDYNENIICNFDEDDEVDDEPEISSENIRVNRSHNGLTNPALNDSLQISNQSRLSYSLDSLVSSESHNFASQSTHPSSSTSSDAPEVEDWHNNFRALFPNVNVSFSSSSRTTPYLPPGLAIPSNSSTNPIHSENGYYNQTSNPWSPKVHIPQPIASTNPWQPPPGFGPQTSVKGHAVNNNIIQRNNHPLSSWLPNLVSGDSSQVQQQLFDDSIWQASPLGVSELPVQMMTQPHFPQAPAPQLISRGPLYPYQPPELPQSHNPVSYINGAGNFVSKPSPHVLNVGPNSQKFKPEGLRKQDIDNSVNSPFRDSAIIGAGTAYLPPMTSQAPAYRPPGFSVGGPATQAPGAPAAPPGLPPLHSLSRAQLSSQPAGSHSHSNVHFNSQSLPHLSVPPGISNESSQNLNPFLQPLKTITPINRVSSSPLPEQSSSFASNILEDKSLRSPVKTTSSNPSSPPQKRNMASKLSAESGPVGVVKKDKDSIEVDATSPPGLGEDKEIFPSGGSKKKEKKAQVQTQTKKEAPAPVTPPKKTDKSPAQVQSQPQTQPSVAKNRTNKKRQTPAADENEKTKEVDDKKNKSDKKNVENGPPQASSKNNKTRVASTLPVGLNGLHNVMHWREKTDTSEMDKSGLPTQVEGPLSLLSANTKEVESLEKEIELARREVKTLADRLTEIKNRGNKVN